MENVKVIYKKKRRKIYPVIAKQIYKFVKNMDFRKHVFILPIFFDSTFIGHINNYSYNWYFYLFAGGCARRININTRAINVKRVSEKKVKHYRTLVRESFIRKNRCMRKCVVTLIIPYVVA